MDKLDWNHLRALQATVTQGSFSAAARALGLTQPTLSRQIHALEQQIGATLFERRGRRLSLTQVGQELTQHLDNMAEAAAAMQLTISGQSAEISGTVRISATDSMATYLLPEILERLRVEAPQVTFELIAANELSNLHQMEADIAIRHVSPDRAGLDGQYLRDTQGAFYASEDWVRRNGHPAQLSELGGELLIGFDDPEMFCAYMCEFGIPVTPAELRLCTNSSVAMWEMARRGMGVATMLREIALRCPDMVRLLPDQPEIPVPIWLVTHEALLHSPRIQLVRRALAEALMEL